VIDMGNDAKIPDKLHNLRLFQDAQR